MKRIIRINSPEEIGLSFQDIENRSLVVLGYCENELLPPYDSQLHESRAEDILKFIETKPNKKYKFISDISEDLESSKKIVELVGGQANFCIESGIGDLLSKGVWAYVNPDLIFTSPKTYPSFLTARILLQEYFYSSHQPNRMCYPLNNALIFGIGEMRTN